MIKVLIFALSFLGLLAGVALSFLAKEELKPGKKYFMLLEKALLLSISILTIFYIKNFFLFLILGIIAGFVFRRAYFYFGLALPLASGSFLVLLSSLVFVFGLPHGTLLAVKLKENIKKEIIFSGILFSAAVLLSLILDYAPLLMLCSGALVSISWRKD